MQRKENADGELCHEQPPAPADWRQALDPRKKIAIVGTAPDSMLLAPYADPSWQVWVCNTMGMGQFVPRWEACFDPHSYDYAGDPYWKDYNAWLCQPRGKPLLTRRQVPEWPDSIAYPVEEITQKYGRYFTSSASWMLALAIEFGAEHIGLWGVNMAHDTEFQQQRPSCEFLVGIAVGKGIAVTIPAQSDLLKTSYLYGFEDNEELHAKWAARYKEFGERHAEHNRQRELHEKQGIFLAGAIDNMRYWRQVFNFADYTPGPVEK